MGRRIWAIAAALALSVMMAMPVLAAGWEKSGSEWAYIKDDGTRAVSCWVEDEYYVDGDGRIITDKWMKLPQRGSAEQTPPMVWYYFGKSGRSVKDGWAKISGRYYYFDAQGVWQKDKK